MKPAPNKPIGGRRTLTLEFLQLCLLPGLMAVLCLGCKQEANVAPKAGETRVATNLNTTTAPEPAPAPATLSVRASASPASFAAGEKTTITIVVSDGLGKPVPGAKVQIDAGGGRFLSGSDELYDTKARLHGPYSASGTSDKEGRFVTWWVVNPAAPAYVLGIRATAENRGEAQTNLHIVIKQ